MKFKLYLSVIFALLLFSCSPTIYYLGDTYSTTDKVDVYYDPKDVQRPYVVIGKMTNEPFYTNDPEPIRATMLEEAKKRGADGIIFTDFQVGQTQECDSDEMAISSSLIKYK